MIRNTTRFLVGAMAAAALLVAGCKDRDRDYDERGVGGSGRDTQELELKGDGVNGQVPSPGVDGKVIGDDQPEMRNDQIGDRPGVINDGEGPVEENVNEEEMKRDVNQ